MKRKRRRVKTPTWGRFAPPSQVPPLAFLFSSSFEFTLNLNYDTKAKKFIFYWYAGRGPSKKYYEKNAVAHVCLRLLFFFFFRSGFGEPIFVIVIQIKRKFKRRRKQKRKRGNLRGGREAPPRRLLHPLRFCFRLRLNLRLI